jgi:hypothetical protein
VTLTSIRISQPIAESCIVNVDVGQMYAEEIQLPCPPHPSDTAPSVSQQEQQGEVKPAPHPHSEDTTGTGAS